MTMDEKLYTLAEAIEEIDRRICRMRGHDYQVSKVFGNDEPTLLKCTRCRKRWDVMPYTGSGELTR